MFMDENNNDLKFQCVCCGYFSLEEKGVAEICIVCFWEDDGETNLDVTSNPNRITIRKGRENFSKFGACKYQFINDVLKNPERKFRKEDFNLTNKKSQQIRWLS